MGPVGKRRRTLISCLAGAALGYFILHPYTMLVYGIHERPHVGRGGGSLSRLWSHVEDVFATFHPGMFHMGLPFALIGGVAGLFFGFWLTARRQKEEAEKRALAMDTLKQLMVTLSHYLLNASTVVGGYAARVLKKETDEDLRRHIEVIRMEAECIEAVVKSLQSVESVVAEHYTEGSETMMIDIHKQLEEKIKESAAKREAHMEQKAA